MHVTKRTSLGFAWYMGLAATIAACGLLAVQLALAPPWAETPPPPIPMFPTLHGPTPSELFAALTGRERQSTIEELKAMRQLIDASPDAATALPTIKVRLATLEDIEEHKQQQETTPALALAAVVGRIDGAMQAIDQAAARVNASPAPAGIAPLSIGVAGLGLLAALLGLLAGAARRTPVLIDTAAPVLGNTIASGPDLAATLRALLDESWSELARQREAASAAANEQAMLGARLTGAVLDAEGRLNAGTDRAEAALAARADSGRGHQTEAAETVTVRLDAICDQLGEAVAALPSVTAVLSEAAETLRHDAGTAAHADHAAAASQAALSSRLDTLVASLEAGYAETVAARGAVDDMASMGRLSALAEQAIGAQAKALDDHLRALSDATTDWRDNLTVLVTRATDATGEATQGQATRGEQDALSAAAGRLLAAAETQAERLETLVRDIVTVAGSLPSAGQGLAESAASIGLAARRQADLATTISDRLAEAIAHVDAANPPPGTTTAGPARDLHGTIAGGLLHAMLPGLDDDDALPACLPATLRHIASVEQETKDLAAQAEALARAEVALPRLWLDGTPALLTCLDGAIHRLRSAATALALAGDGSPARRVA